jgi:hypothetical protein
MQQATALNGIGNYLWLAPDITFTVKAPEYFYDAISDGLKITLEAVNIGDAIFPSHLYLSAYDGSIDVNNLIAVDSVTVNISPEDKTLVTFIIRDYSAQAASLTGVTVNLNDRGKALYIQKECETANNSVAVPLTSILMARNDTVSMLINTDVTIDVKLNDHLPAACSGAVPSVTVNPTGGLAAIVNDSIKYTPVTGFFGVDSLVYRLSCSSGIAEAKVYIVVSKPIADQYIACAGTSVTAGFEAIADVSYSWYITETGGLPDGSQSNTRGCSAPGEWRVEAEYKGRTVKPRLRVIIAAYPALTAGSIGSDQTKCNGRTPDELTETGSPGGGNGSYTCQWQQSPDNVNWTDIPEATTCTAYSPPALKSDTYYRRNVTSCTTVSGNSVKIKVYPASLYDYPDIRIRICPDAGKFVNLSKYIDTVELTYLKWESVSPNITVNNTEFGLISTDNLNALVRVYTFTYTASNPCASSITRKVYLETLKPERMRPLRDTVVICYEQAEAVQINQIFGIEANGTWEYHSNNSGDVDAYVTKSASGAYEGAVIMNGKAIYESAAIPPYFYHGINTKKVEFTYITDENSCLNGEKYKTVIILMSDI